MEISHLRASLLTKSQFDIDNDKLTRFYTEIPPYDLPMALVEFLEPKPKR